MKRIPIVALGAAALLVLVGCASGSTDTSYAGPTDNPSVGITTHSVVVSGAGTIPTPARASAKPTPPPKPTPTAAPEATSPADSSSGGSSGGGGGGVPVILSPAGNHYRAGEFCPTADAGVTTVDAQGRKITCVMESGRYHWHYA